MPLAAGTRLGPYEVVEPLGKGAMGEVYRARDSRLGRDVAIKVLPDRTAASADALARFEFEAQAVAALNHPNILALHDVGSAAGVAYAVTELLEGNTLRERLVREGPLPPRRALDMAIQFAQGLAAAHAQGFVHRDLKPENLFLTTDGRVKILDFGIATHASTSPAASAADTRLATQDGLLVGTVGYMAPEQARGLPASAASDIFAFGLVVHEAITGSNPFDRPTAADTMTALLRDDHASLVGRPGVPPVAARLIDRCLEKRPEDRPDSLRDVALFLQVSSDPAPEGTAEERTVATARIRALARRSLAAVATLLVILTAASWAYVRTRGLRAAGDAMTSDLTRAVNVVGRAQQDRLGRLLLSARLVASFPQLKALFETSAPTVRDFLTNYQRGNLDTPLLIALGPEGYIVARGDDASGAASETGETWLKSLRASGDAGVITLDGKPYHAAVASAEAGGTIFGSILAAAPIDNAFAQMLREATEDEVVLLDVRGVAGASLRSGQVPWDSLPAFRAAVAGRAGPVPFAINGTRVSAVEVPLGRDPEVAAVVLAAGDDVTGSYRRTEYGILLIGAAGFLILLGVGLTAIKRIERSRDQDAARS